MDLCVRIVLQEKNAAQNDGNRRKQDEKNSSWRYDNSSTFVSGSRAERCRREDGVMGWGTMRRESVFCG